MDSLHRVGFTWYDGRRTDPFLRKMFLTLTKWTSETIEEFDEVPFGYTEWTLTGHLAIAADRCGFFSVQEYTVADTGGETKPNWRPDLYIKGPDDSFDCVFEVKSANTSLDARSLDGRIRNRLTEAWKKLFRYGRDEARYCCAVVGLPVWIPVNKWDSMCASAREYGSSRNQLCQKLKDSMENLHTSSEDAKPDFYCGYFLKHDNALEWHKMAKREGWDTSVIGILWIGGIRKSQDHVS